MKCTISLYCVLHCMAKYARETTLDIRVCGMYHFPILCVTLYGKVCKETTLDIRVLDMYHLPILCVTLNGKVCKGNNSEYKSM